MPYMFGLLALVVCICAMPLARGIAKRWKLYDLPAPLKIHRRPTPRVGGIAMLAGLLASLMLLPLEHDSMFAILAFVVVWAIGLVDDATGLSPGIRLGFQFLAGTLLWAGGWQLPWTNSAILNWALTCLSVAFLINAANLFDGIDGLAAGTSAIIAIGFLVLLSGTPAFFSTIVAWSLLGICLGVLVHNLPPASVFMGDSGSTLIGIAWAFLILDWVRTQPSHNVVPPTIVVSIPAVDALLAIGRRLRSGRSPFFGDRRHCYDLLLKRGLSVGRVLALLWGLTAILGAVAWLSRGEPHSLQTAMAVIVVTIAFAIAAHLLGSVRPEAKSSPLLGSLKPNAE